NTNAQHGRPNAEKQREADGQCDQPGGAEPGQHAERATNGRDHHCFNQKLREDVFAPRADCLANADLFGALGHGDEHDIHHDNAADHQRDRGDSDGYQINVRSRGRIQIQKHVLSLQRKAIVTIVVENLAATIAHDRPHLVLSIFQLLRVLRLDENHEHAAGTECLTAEVDSETLLVSGKRNVDAIVTRDAENLAQRLEHADDQITMAADPDVLIDRAIRRITGKEICDYVGSDDANVSTRGAFAFRPDSARIDRHAVDIE